MVPRCSTDATVWPRAVRSLAGREHGAGLPPAGVRLGLATHRCRKFMSLLLHPVADIHTAPRHGQDQKHEESQYANEDFHPRTCPLRSRRRRKRERMTGADAAGAVGWVAPHLLQNLAPSASGFPQLTQNAAMGNASCQARHVTKPLSARQGAFGTMVSGLLVYQFGPETEKLETLKPLCQC